MKTELARTHIAPLIVSGELLIVVGTSVIVSQIRKVA